MPADSADDETGGDEGLLDRWGDPEQPFGDPEESALIPESPPITGSASEAADAEADAEADETEQLTKDLSEVDPDLLNTFAVSVVLANLGVLLVSVGILLVVFRGQLRLGGGLAVVGALTLGRVWQYYRAYKRDREDDTVADTEPDDDSPDSGIEPDDGRESDTNDPGTTETNDQSDTAGHNS